MVGLGPLCKRVRESVLHPFLAAVERHGQDLTRHRVEKASQMPNHARLRSYTRQILGLLQVCRLSGLSRPNGQSLCMHGAPESNGEGWHCVWGQRAGARMSRVRVVSLGKLLANHCGGWCRACELALCAGVSVHTPTLHEGVLISDKLASLSVLIA